MFLRRSSFILPNILSRHRRTLAIQWHIGYCCIRKIPANALNSCASCFGASNESHSHGSANRQKLAAFSQFHGSRCLRRDLQGCCFTSAAGRKIIQSDESKQGLAGAHDSDLIQRLWAICDNLQYFTLEQCPAFLTDIVQIPSKAKPAPNSKLSLPGQKADPRHCVRICV